MFDFQRSSVVVNCIEWSGRWTMSDNNALRFETNPYHNISLKDRKVLELSGVKCIDSFDANEFLLDTSQGWMIIRGKELTLAKLDTDHGDVIIKGTIDAMEYITSKKGSGKESIISKMFK